MLDLEKDKKVSVESAMGESSTPGCSKVLMERDRSASSSYPYLPQAMAHLESTIDTDNI